MQRVWPRCHNKEHVNLLPRICDQEFLVDNTSIVVQLFTGCFISSEIEVRNNFFSWEQLGNGGLQLGNSAGTVAHSREDSWALETIHNNNNNTSNSNNNNNNNNTSGNRSSTTAASTANRLKTSCANSDPTDSPIPSPSLLDMETSTNLETLSPSAAAVPTNVGMQPIAGDCDGGNGNSIPHSNYHLNNHVTAAASITPVIYPSSCYPIYDGSVYHDLRYPPNHHHHHQLHNSIHHSQQEQHQQHQQYHNYPTPAHNMTPLPLLNSSLCSSLYEDSRPWSQGSGSSSNTSEDIRYNDYPGVIHHNPQSILLANNNNSLTPINNGHLSHQHQQDILHHNSNTTPSILSSGLSQSFPPSSLIYNLDYYASEKYYSDNTGGNDLHDSITIDVKNSTHNPATNCVNGANAMVYEDHSSTIESSTTTTYGASVLAAVTADRQQDQQQQATRKEQPIQQNHYSGSSGSSTESSPTHQPHQSSHQQQQQQQQSLPPPPQQQQQQIQQQQQQQNFANYGGTNSVIMASGSNTTISDPMKRPQQQQTVGNNKSNGSSDDTDNNTISNNISSGSSTDTPSPSLAGEGDVLKDQHTLQPGYTSVIVDTQQYQLTHNGFVH